MARLMALASMLCVFLGCSHAAADEPPKPATPEARPVLPILFKSAEREIQRHLKVVLFQDSESGESAALQLTPILPGCKVGLTYRF
jgi:hypothetical protein